METISVYPNSKAEAAFIKEFLNRLKVPFQVTKEDLQDWQIALIRQGATDIANGNVSSFEEVMQKAETLCQRR